MITTFPLKFSRLSARQSVIFHLDQDNLIVELEDQFDIPNQRFQHCNRPHRPFERTFDNRDIACRPGIWIRKRFLDLDVRRSRFATI